MFCERFVSCYVYTSKCRFRDEEINESNLAKFSYEIMPAIWLADTSHVCLLVRRVTKRQYCVMFCKYVGDVITWRLFKN
jgi:hypothetical protein